MDDRWVHLVRLSDGAVVEAEEVDELIEELTDAAAGDVHGAAESLSGRQTGYSHRKKKPSSVWFKVRNVHSRGELPHPEEVVPHADGELVASQPQHAHRRGGQFRDAASNAGQLTAEQLLPVQRGLAPNTTARQLHVAIASCQYELMLLQPANICYSAHVSCQYRLISLQLLA